VRAVLRTANAEEQADALIAPAAALAQVPEEDRPAALAAIADALAELGEGARLAALREARGWRRPTPAGQARHARLRRHTEICDRLLEKAAAGR
jgi:hypothetical protein